MKLPPGPHIIGHRGMGRSTAPRIPLTHSFIENTRESFLAAYHAGADWIELDVITTPDGEILLWHDQFIADDHIHKSSRELLVTLGAEDFRTLGQVLPPGLGINVEVKPMPRARHARCGEEMVLEEIEHMIEDRPILWSSFDPTIAKRGSEVNVPTAWITHPNYPLHEAAIAAINMGTDALMVHAPTTLENAHRPALLTGLEIIHSEKLPLWCWDVTTEKIDELLPLGVEGFLH